MVKLLKIFKRNLFLCPFLGIIDFIKVVLLKWKADFSQNESLWNINEKIHKIFYNYIDKNLSSYRMIDYKKCYPLQKNIDDQHIWVCWLQGEKAMPDIVHVCYQSILKNANGHKVILITWDNLDSYIYIPNSIREKVGKGLSYTMFSDYIRLNLLSYYGGLWIDATFFVTQPLDNSIFDHDFFSIKNNVHANEYVCRYRWAVNFIYASSKCTCIRHIRNLFSFYWEKNNNAINYLLIDYCFEYERMNNKEFNSTLENLPCTNEFSHEIRINFNKEFNSDAWKKWLSNTSLFKLTYKGHLLESIEERKPTFYGYILTNYKESY